MILYYEQPLIFWYKKVFSLYIEFNEWSQTFVIPVCDILFFRIMETKRNQILLLEDIILLGIRPNEKYQSYPP